MLASGFGAGVAPGGGCDGEICAGVETGDLFGDGTAGVAFGAGALGVGAGDEGTGSSIREVGEVELTMTMDGSGWVGLAVGFTKGCGGDSGVGLRIGDGEGTADAGVENAES